MVDAGDFGAWLMQAREALRGTGGSTVPCGDCTIYGQRPQTCLDYDCRVFAAAGLEAGGEAKAVINRRVRDWRFQFASDADRQAHAAIRTAAAFIRDAHAQFPPGAAPCNPLGIAALALRVYSIFLPPGPPVNQADTARAVLAAGAAFDGGHTIEEAHT